MSDYWWVKSNNSIGTLVTKLKLGEVYVGVYANPMVSRGKFSARSLLTEECDTFELEEECKEFLIREAESWIAKANLMHKGIVE